MSRFRTLRQRLSKSRLCCLYARIKRAIRNQTILVVLISIILASYAVHTCVIEEAIISVYLFYKKISGTGILPLVLLGSISGLSYEEANEIIDYLIPYLRVSSASQEDNYSKVDQDEALQPEINRLDAEIAMTVDDDHESASTMWRENIRNIIRTIENSDDTFCLMFSTVDRLSRADPLEACVFIWAMREQDAIFYFEELGYLDLSTLHQQLLIMFKLVTSRDEYTNIVEGGEDGRLQAKKNGKFPAQAPYGYKTTDSDSVTVVDPQRDVIQRAAELIIHGEDEVPSGNISAAHNRIRDEFEDKHIPCYNTLLRVVRDRRYTGVLTHDGEDVGSIPQILTDDTYTKLQDKLPDQTESNSEEALDDELLDVICELGPLASLVVFEDIIKGRCPWCGGDVVSWGSSERWGNVLENHRCIDHPEVNEENYPSKTASDSVCRYDGPLLNEKRLQEWENTVPLQCSACQHHLDDENWEQYQRNDEKRIKQECGNCGIKIELNLSDNKFKRREQLPEQQIKFFQEDDVEETSTEEDNDDDDDDGQKQTEQDGYNRSLSEFAEG